MFALMKSMQTHYEIPSTFDGEMPQLAFQGSSRTAAAAIRPHVSRTHRGRTGSSRRGSTMRSCRKRKSRWSAAIELATGVCIIAICPISDAELAAYRAYPDTFFGEIRQPTRHAKTLVDWCDFFYETYKNTPRDKLLEWMAGAPDIEQLRTLPQEDLAIIICERWAYDTFQTGNQKHAS